MRPARGCKLARQGESPRDAGARLTPSPQPIRSTQGEHLVRHNHPQEARRLSAVRRYDILDTPPDGTFDRITALAARLFGVPISIVSIVDEDRIWFKSHHGLSVEQVDREPGLCASAILQDDPWILPDARSDPRALANSLVAGQLGLRFYAGVPLRTHDGHNLGTLCVIDREPREITSEEIETLADLASVVMDELELRLAARRSVGVERSRRRGAEDVARALQETLLPPELPAVPGVDIAARYHVANSEQVGGDFYDVMADGDRFAAVVGDACGKGAKAAALTGTARWTLRTIALDPWTPAEALRRLNRVTIDANNDPERYCTVALASCRRTGRGTIELTVALAGHPRPLILRASGDVEEVGETAPAVGWLAESAFRDASTELNVGDVLVMFTDGMLEAIAGHGSTDDSAIRRVLLPHAGDTKADDVAAALDAALGTGVLRDDAAFLVIRNAS